MQYFPSSLLHFPVSLKLRPLDQLQMWYRRAQGVLGHPILLLLKLMASHPVTIVADSFNSNLGTLNSQPSLVPPGWISVFSCPYCLLQIRNPWIFADHQLLRPGLTSKHQLVEFYPVSSHFPPDLYTGLNYLQSLVSVFTLQWSKLSILTSTHLSVWRVSLDRWSGHVLTCLTSTSCVFDPV